MTDHRSLRPGSGEVVMDGRVPGSSDFGEPFGSEPFDTLRAVSKVEPLRAELLSQAVISGG